jgi:hypothetical protein
MKLPGRQPPESGIRFRTRAGIQVVTTAELRELTALIRAARFTPPSPDPDDPKRGESPPGPEKVIRGREPPV